MKTKLIVLSAKTIQAILDGKKTQIRRMIKPQPNIEFYCMSFEYPHAQIRCNEEEAQATILRSPKTNRACFIDKAPLLYNGKGANYKVGDILWVRETCFEDYRENWKSAIHMPKEVARIFLEVTNVRVERLQNITENDVLAEGKLSLESFKEHWISIYGKQCWNNNPFVWVYEFKQVEKPFNFLK